MEELNRLFQIVGQLRAENGCPWDRAQDFSTMRPYLLEEVYETLAAMDLPPGPERNKALEEELGDLSFVLLYFSLHYFKKEMFQIIVVLRNFHTKSPGDRENCYKEVSNKYW